MHAIADNMLSFTNWDARKEENLVKTDSAQFFSVLEELILVGHPLPYDIYINSSKREGADRFVRVYPKGDVLDSRTRRELKQKYIQLYISEFHRTAYLKSLMNHPDFDDVKKVDIIKDSAITYLDRLFDGEKEFNTELLEDTLNGCRDSVECMVDTLQDYDISALQGLIGNLSFHDFYTYDHSINVAMYCIAIYKALKPTASRYEQVQAGLGGLLHDLGKIKVPTSIINKVGKLTDEEFGIIKQHPGFGLEMLDETVIDAPVIDFKELGRVINEHHENFDGTGYPNKLAGDQISLLARICAVADFFDAITTKRSYNQVLDIQEAVNVMSRTVGKKLDPFIFKVFQRTVKKFVQKDNVKFELDANFDSERPFDELPLVKIEDLESPRQTNKVQFMDHKNKPKQNYGKVKGNGNAFISGKKKKAS